MEKGRWKVRICLIGIVMAAILSGILYYNSSSNQYEGEEGGVLVQRECEVQYDS